MPSNGGLLPKLRPRRRSKKPTGTIAAETPPSPPVYMRTTISSISNLLRYSPWSSAQSQLHLLPIRWDSFTINQVLKTHPPMEKSWLFFNWASKLPSFKHDHFTYTTMLDIFGEAGRIKSMLRVFQDMEEKGIAADAATYTSLMHWMGKAGDFDGAVRAWEEMRSRGCRPTLVSYTAFIKVLFDHGRPREAVRVYKEMLEVGLTPNCQTYTVLMEYLAGEGKFDAVLEVMNKMQEVGIRPDKAMCNILVQKCSKAGETSVMAQILQFMKENFIVLRRPIFLEALEALKIFGESDRLLREVNPHLSCEGMVEEITDSESTATDISSEIDRRIIIYLLAMRNFVAIEHILSESLHRNLLLDSNIISAVVHANYAAHRSTGALTAFEYCIKMRQILDKPAYISLLGLSIRSGLYQKVLEIVEEMVGANICLGTYLVSLLIYKLGCSGFPAFSEKLYYLCSTDQNTATCTALISAYLQAGEVEKGLDVYSRMRNEGIPVSVGTYAALVVGLEKAGRPRDAVVYQKEKKRLEWCYHSRGTVSLEESLCDCLFDGGYLLHVMVRQHSIV
ncbi:putative tetratricopeptide-like helical domain superfamily, pentacotripeptide-repeat region of PRORP [Dioscorea sansibarensis]